MPVLQRGRNQEYWNGLFHICSKCCIPAPETLEPCLDRSGACTAEFLPHEPALSEGRTDGVFLSSAAQLFFAGFCSSTREYSILPELGASVNKLLPLGKARVGFYSLYMSQV